jgi:hypothetical protein
VTGVLKYKHILVTKKYFFRKKTILYRTADIYARCYNFFLLSARLKEFFLVLFSFMFYYLKLRSVKLFLLIIPIIVSSCVATNSPQRKAIKNLQKGRIKDDSSYVYALPFEKGNTHLVVQGYYSAYSHKNRAAIDFKMKRGTKITASRGGVVVRLKEDSNQGGLNKKYRQFANLVIIQHEDGSRAGYWHLQQNGVLVNLGDTVKQGQVIALSGKTGYAALPHLHFLVWTNKNNQWQQVATRFRTNKGDRYIRPFRKYKNERREKD